MLQVGMLMAVLGMALLAQPTTPQKKLIEYGWDVPMASYVATHIAEMEQRPFDGVAFSIQPGVTRSPLSRVRWGGAELEKELAALRTIKWGRFTDNYLIAYSASNMDWFSDDDWDAVSYNAGLLARAAREGGCKGIFFDPEPYGKNPWHYHDQPRAGEKSFHEYQAMVRRRGAQFMTALQQHYPGIVLHTFFFANALRQRDLDPNDPASLPRLISDDPREINRRGLYPSFMNGLLDAAAPGVIINDGNELSYYFTKAAHFTSARERILGSNATLVAPEVRAAYAEHVRNAPAIYVDYLYGRSRDVTPGAYLTPEEQTRWCVHNVYHALSTADTCVWFYSERMNWWTGKDLPPGILDAITTAKQKVADGQPLGYTIDDMIYRARTKMPK